MIKKQCQMGVSNPRCLVSELDKLARFANEFLSKINFKVLCTYFFIIFAKLLSIDIFNVLTDNKIKSNYVSFEILCYFYNLSFSKLVCSFSKF